VHRSTTLYEVAQDDDGRPLIILYVGDYDPSGMWMSERDIPERIARYGGEHIEVRRIAITASQTPDCRHSRPPTNGRTRAAVGSSRPSASGVGSLMRWTRRSCGRPSRQGLRP
jgi:hypothetical protein